jgi:inner membrane transporter RhtA
VPAPALFVVSGLTQYLGAAIAVGLFAVLAPATVAWLRLVAAAIVLVAWQRPWRRVWHRRAVRDAAVFGVALAAMNVAFYVAISHLPLGTAVTIEFIGPVAVAAITGRTARERAAIAVAAAGVVLLAGASLQLGPGAATGLVAIGCAAACWAGYILLGRSVARAAPLEPGGRPEPGAGAGLTGLAVAMAVGALVFSPLAGGAGPVLTDPRLAALVFAVGVLSSVVPYAVEQVVMRRVSAATFAVLLAILPASAVLVGAVALHQLPTLPELGGLVLVSAGIVLTAPSGRPPAPA